MTQDYGANLVLNPTIKKSDSKWFNDSGDVDENKTYGGRFFDGTGTAGRAIAHATFNVIASAAYGLSGVQYIRRDSDTGRFGLELKFFNSSDVQVGSTWTQSYTLGTIGERNYISRVEFTAPATAKKARLYVVCPDTTAPDHYATNFVFRRAGTPPTANAGSDQVSEQGEFATLTGSHTGGSSSVFNYYWTPLGDAPAPVSPDLPTVNVGPFVNAGTAKYILTVWDSNGLYDTDDVQVTVGIADAPTADAGPAQTIYSGSSATLNGSASSVAGVASWAWEETSDGGITITSPTSQSTAVGPFADPGTYTFQLTATDVNARQGQDTVTVSVLEAPAEDAPLLDRLRLELQADEKDSEIANHSGVGSSTSGWTATYGTLTTQTIASGFNGSTFRVASDGSNRAGLVSSAWPVIPDEWVNVGGTFETTSARTVLQVFVEFLDGSSTVIGQAYSEGLVYSASGAANFSAIGKAPYGATTARMRVHSITQTTGQYLYMYESYAYSGIYSDVAGFGFVNEGENWQQVLGDSISVSIDRGSDLSGVEDQAKVGLLTAVMVNANSTPDKNPRLRPGNKVRVTTFNPSSGGFEPLFTGSIAESSAQWERDEATITLTANDGLAALNNISAPLIYDGSFRERVDLLMTDIPVEYMVADASLGTSTGTAISQNNDNTALQSLQLITTTAHGALWVDSGNVVRISSLSAASTAVSATFSDEPLDVTATEYHDIDAGYSTADVVNSLTVNFNNILTDPSQAEENTKGPFSDLNSQQQNGLQSASVTVIDGDAEDHAEQWLATYSEAKLTARSLKFSGRRNNRQAVELDLFQCVSVKFSPAGLNSLFRVIGIKHTVGPNSWEVEVLLRPLEVQAAGVVVEDPPAGPDTGPSDLLPTSLRYDTGWDYITDLGGYESGYNGNGTPGEFAVRRQGNNVSMKGGVDKNSGDFSNASFVRITNTALPTHYRPNSTCRFVCGATGTRTGNVEVRTDGHVYVAASSFNATGVTWIGTFGSWPQG